MVISVALAREQARLVIRGSEICERSWATGQAPSRLVSTELAGAGKDQFDGSSSLCSKMLHTVHLVPLTTY